MTIPTGAAPEREEVLERIDAVLETLNTFRESQMAFNESQVAFNGKVIERLDRTDERLTKIDERFDRMDERFDRMDECFDRMDERFDRTDERLTRMDERFDRMDERFDRTDERFDRTDERLTRMDERFDRTDERLTSIDERLDRTDERLTNIDGRLNRSDERSDKMEQHLGYLRGAHAANTARRNASLIADDMGYQVITLLPREELIGFAKAALDSGKADNDVRSFREADLVMLVRDDRGRPAYIAVEASFTVANSDIRRAMRNAQYLEQFTGLPARAAVAGVDIALGREQNAVVDGVFCYRIPTRNLEAD